PHRGHDVDRRGRHPGDSDRRRVGHADQRLLTLPGRRAAHVGDHRLHDLDHRRLDVWFVAGRQGRASGSNRSSTLRVGGKDMETAVTPATPDETPVRGYGQTLMDLFIAPGDAFADLVKKPRVLVVLLLLTAFSLVLTGVWLAHVDMYEMIRAQ